VKRLGGRGQLNPHKNGEYKILEAVIKMSGEQVVLFDGGANVGDYAREFKRLCERHIKKANLILIEPFPSTRKVLEDNLGSADYKLFEVALGESAKDVDFYFDSDVTNVNGSNSVYKHYYLNTGKIQVKQDTLDNIASQMGTKNIDMMKLDIEGSELNALKGATTLLSSRRIKYIQLEYNQTWLKGNSSIEGILDLCQKFGYRLFRVSQKGLISIPSYHYILDDFVYSNLFLVSNDIDLPLPVIRKALPFI
jgi:FkbM family methyltransferase